MSDVQLSRAEASQILRVIDTANRAVDTATKEFLSIHTQLDALEVPRTVNDEKLSAAQRVAILVGAYKSACTRVAKGG